MTITLSGGVGTFYSPAGLSGSKTPRMEFMKIKFVIMVVLTALLPNLCANAGESQASSAASTMNQSNSGNQQSSQASTGTSSSATTSTSSSASGSAASNATTQNPNNRGTVVRPTPALIKATASAPQRARAAAKTKYYNVGYKKSAAKPKTARWQTKTYR